MIIFISCTKTKAKEICKAKDMYSPSQWFRLAYRYAKSLKPSAIYILSAKYGLLSPDDEIKPYEKTLVSEKDAEIRKWSLMVAKQIKAKVANREEAVVFLCGKNYRKYIQNLFPKHTAPVSHYGIGKQMQFFKNNTAKGEA